MMRRLLKWTGLGCLGLVVLVVVFGVIGAVVAPPPQGGDPVEQVKEKGQQQGDGQEKQPQPQAPEKPEDRLEISGTADAASCSVLDDKNSRSVDVGVPSTIKLEVGFGGVASVNCQKQGAQGRLKLELFVDGNREAVGSTSAEYGLVQLNYPS
jgi:hypothetical protein